MKAIVWSKPACGYCVKAKNLLKRDFNPISDIRASKKYRLEVAENLLLKFFIETKTKKLFRVYQ